MFISFLERARGNFVCDPGNRSGSVLQPSTGLAYGCEHTILMRKFENCKLISEMRWLNRLEVPDESTEICELVFGWTVGKARASKQQPQQSHPVASVLYRRMWKMYAFLLKQYNFAPCWRINHSAKLARLPLKISPTFRQENLRHPLKGEHNPQNKTKYNTRINETAVSLGISYVCQLPCGWFCVVKSDMGQVRVRKSAVFNSLANFWICFPY